MSPPRRSCPARPRAGELGDQRQDRRVRPVLRPAGAVELQPRAGRGGLGVLAGVRVAVEVGEDDRRRRDAAAAQPLDDAEPHRPVLAVDADRGAGARVCARGRGCEHGLLERLQPVVARADLDQPRADARGRRRPATKRSASSSAPAPAQRVVRAGSARRGGRRSRRRRAGRSPPRRRAALRGCGRGRSASSRRACSPPAADERPRLLDRAARRR